MMAVEEVKKLCDQTLPVFAKCDCCGFTEECTQAYITAVREKHGGRWICGLCSEAVKEETSRCDGDIGSGEALDRHMRFYQEFRSSNPAEELISAMKQLLRRALDSPEKQRGSPCKEATPRVYSVGRTRAN